MYPFPHLPRSLSQAVFAELCRCLPPPSDDTETARTDRDLFAMAAVAALDPRDAAEAMLAVRVIAHEAHARMALESAVRRHDDPIEANQSRAQAALMGREAQRVLRSLQTLQAARPLPNLPTQVAGAGPDAAAALDPVAPGPIRAAGPPWSAHRQSPEAGNRPAYGIARGPAPRPRLVDEQRSSDYETTVRKSKHWDNYKTRQPTVAISQANPGPMAVSI
jgi:hypothetical protein